MTISIVARKRLSASCGCFTRQNPRRRSYFATAALHSAEDSKLPRVANPSFWSSLIPRPFRRASDPAEAEERAKKRQVGSEERRAGIIFMILGVLVGSNAIQLIALKRQTTDFSRKTDAKLALLREVVERVKNGEDVDVKKVLGTGDPEHEKEWEEVIRELETSDVLRGSAGKRESRRSNKPEASKEISSSDTAAEKAGTRPKFLM